VASSDAAKPNDPMTNHITQLPECANAKFTVSAFVHTPSPSMATVVMANGTGVATHQITAKASSPSRVMPRAVIGSGGETNMHPASATRPAAMPT
jgi:hypothetical protein